MDFDLSLKRLLPVPCPLERGFCLVAFSNLSAAFFTVSCLTSCVISVGSGLVVGEVSFAFLAGLVTDEGAAGFCGEVTVLPADIFLAMVLSLLLWLKLLGLDSNSFFFNLLYVGRPFIGKDIVLCLSYEQFPCLDLEPFELTWYLQGP